MIIYATKKTVDRYKLKMPEDFQEPTMRQIALDVLEKEKGDSLLEWGAKLFYFDRRKCIQVCNFASKFTLVLVDVKVADLENIGDLIAHYMLDIYSDDKEMLKLLERYFAEAPLLCFSKLQDRRIISSLNRMQLDYLQDGYGLYHYIDDEGILRTRKLNYGINCKYIVTDKINGKTEYFMAAERFAELLKKRYKYTYI